MDCSIYVAKTKALISCVVNSQLICPLVFAYAKNRFSHEEAHMIFLRKPAIDIYKQQIISAYASIKNLDLHFRALLPR